MIFVNFVPNSNLNVPKIVSCMQCDEHNSTTLYTNMDVTSLPPYKNLVPRFLGFRKESGVLGS